MQVFRHYQNLPEQARGAVIAIGNFDGIHRGHQEVIAKAGRLAREFNAPQAVLTFEPHPRGVFQPDLPPFRLTPFRLKARLIEALGVDYLFVPPFDLEFAALSAEEFAEKVLGECLGARYVVVGDDFRFGRKRRGDIPMLQDLGRSHGFGVTGVDRVTSVNAEPYSSTLVRDYLKAGNPTRAALLLGRYWEIEGRVQKGDQRGRNLGFPTANIPLGEILRPSYGVYAVRAGLEHDGGITWYGGVANLGIRPMWETEDPMLEVFLFGYSGDLYGQHLRVALVDYLRPEMNFDDVEALKAQMANDCERAKASIAFEEWDDAWPVSPFMASPGDLPEPRDG